MVYYVTSRGASDPVIRDQQDYDTYMGLVGEYQQRYGFRLFAYCMVPDQVHLCLEPAQGTTISAIMHDLTTRYTKYYNRRYGRTGHLFQERFKAVLVEKEHSLLFVTACLHRWPTQCGLMSDFSAYPFSSYARYMGAAGPGPIQMDAEIAEILRLLPDEHTPEAYQRYVTGLTPAESERPMRSRILGSEAFIQRVKDRLSGPARLEPQASAQALEGSIATPLRRQAVLMTAGSLTAAVLGFGMIVASLYQRLGSVEDGIVVLSQENEAAFLSRQAMTVQQAKAEAFASLESAVWEIRLMPINGPAGGELRQDELSFAGEHLISRTFAAEGFTEARYLVRVEPDGASVWEAAQSHANGDVVTWKGEWRSDVMRGTMTRQAAGGAHVQMGFVGAARLATDAGRRSEI